MKRNHSGFTLIELIVVIAILGILTSAAVGSVSTVFSSKERKCANSIDALLSQCKVLTLSGMEEPVLQLKQESDGYYGTIYVGGSEHSGTLLGSETLEIYFTVAGNDYDLSTGNLYLAFDRETGAFRKLEDVAGNAISGSCTDISVGSYSIELTPSTGYHRLNS